jgi:L-iditol 2-dehydrogenase
MATDYPAAYDPVAVLQHPDYKIIEGVPSRDVEQNLAIAYAPGAKLHLIQKPVPTAREGEVVIHVRASGICGSDIHFWRASTVSYSFRRLRRKLTSFLVQHGRIGDTMVVRDVCGCGHECK